MREREKYHIRIKERRWIPNVIMQPMTEGIKSLLLLPRAICTPGRPALAPPTSRVDRGFVAPSHPCPRLNYDVPHLSAGLVHGVRSSLPLGYCAEDIGYMGRRDEGRHHTVMARRDEMGVSTQKIRVKR